MWRENHRALSGVMPPENTSRPSRVEQVQVANLAGRQPELLDVDDCGHGLGLSARSAQSWSADVPVLRRWRPAVFHDAQELETAERVGAPSLPGLEDSITR